MHKPYIRADAIQLRNYCRMYTSVVSRLARVYAFQNYYSKHSTLVMPDVMTSVHFLILIGMPGHRTDMSKSHRSWLLYSA